MKKDKTVEMLTPTCEHGRAMARITEDDGSFVTQITRMNEGDPIDPGETMMTTEPIEGEPRLRRVIDEFTRPGPSRAATPGYRKGYDNIQWN